jgi:CrcB protein
MGILATWLDQRGISSPTVRLFWVTGLLGAFTTFSAFSFETIKLIEDGKMLHATANAAGSVVACVFAVMAGIAVARAL